MLKGRNEIENILYALSEQMEAEGVGNLEMVVCGGAALNILGFVDRVTKDVDIMAFVNRGQNGKITLTKTAPLGHLLMKAAEKVGKDFNLPENWLNEEPAAVLDSGLPEGLMGRVETRKYGENLTIHFLSRYDQIHFKLHAAVDQTSGRHYEDLMSLNPTAKELEEAACWTMQQDPSEGYRMVLKDFLMKAGHKDVAQRL